ncbi:MAG: hypothetical protein Q4B48_01600, partial [Syntrophomonadaceae bacterium]|nr:hypothetical protein [Syntrophomonadaceae bacterium]
EPVYKEAAVHIKTDGRDIEQIVDDILKRLNQ